MLERYHRFAGCAMCECVSRSVASDPRVEFDHRCSLSSASCEKSFDEFFVNKLPLARSTLAMSLRAEMQDMAHSFYQSTVDEFEDRLLRISTKYVRRRVNIPTEVFDALRTQAYLFASAAHASAVLRGAIEGAAVYYASMTYRDPLHFFEASKAVKMRNVSRSFDL
jgi:hypothetical protein